MKKWLILLFIVVSIYSCITGGETISADNTYIGEKISEDNNKQLLTFSVAYYPMLITDQQISNDDWTTFRASTATSGFYRNDNDQPGRSAFDFYRPVNKEDNLAINGKLPMIIFIHCGAFITGKKDDDLIISSLCRDFTRKGFATASINYRLLINTDNIIAKTTSIVGAMLSKENRNRTLYHNSICDIRRAVQYFRLNADKYGIDSDNIFLFGYSAGAIAALHAIYLNQERASIWIHNMGGYSQSEGDIKKPNVRGVISISGGFFRPPNEMWQDDDSTPLLLIQGDDDEMVPYGEGRPFQRYIKDYRLNSPYIGEININKSDRLEHIEYTTLKARLGLQIDAVWVDFLRDQFTDNMYGSSIIKNNKSNNCTLVTINGGKHYFAVDSSSGCFNESYFTMREHALQFINQNKKENNDL